MRNRASTVAAPWLPTEISKEAHKTGETIREKTDLPDEELDKLLDTRKMTEV